MNSNNLLSAESIMSDTVKNADGKDLGKVKELMLNPINGKVDYAVLSFGGFMGMGDKYFAVPWDAMNIDKKDKSIRLNIPKEKLETMEGFDKDNWPDFANPQFEASIHKSFEGVGSYSRPTPRM